MFFANDKLGNRVHISDAHLGVDYFCPACGHKMVLRWGNINTHHFAHKPGKECDRWYSKKLSKWHQKMQNHFNKSEQEIIVWNEQHTEFHIADVLVRTKNRSIVLEFQHSVISQSEFLQRCRFYKMCGHQVIWIFDFCECKNSKKILIADDQYDDNVVQLVWPGRDRIRFLDGIDFSEFLGSVYIVFHIRTGKGKVILHQPHGYVPWETWEYLDPINKKCYFALLYLKHFTGTFNFYAKCYAEEEFYKELQSLKGNM